MNKQHIVGLIIFTLIVGTSVVIGSFFIKIPEVKSVTVSEYDSYTYKSERKCRRKKRKKRKKRRSDEEVSVKIDQAVLNVKTQKLSLDISSKSVDGSIPTTKVALQFFVNDKYSTRHLATEYIEINSDSAIREMSSFNWLKNLQTKENLYIIPQVLEENGDFSEYNPIFRESKATAILLRGIDGQ